MSRRNVYLRRSLIGIAGAVLLALLAAVVAAVVLTREPLPTTDGELTISGLEDEARVLRDDQGVPHIYASTSADLFMAQGFVHAQDRFFEMDYRRHVTSGRLAELVGDDEDAIEADKVIRTFGWRDVAEQEWELLDPQAKAYLTAYADGVNAYLSSRSANDLAFEYNVLGAVVTVDEPEAWDPVDSLAWLKAMAWDLRGNYDAELDRAQSYLSIRDVARVEELFPPYPEGTNTPILSGPAAQANLDVATAQALAEAAAAQAAAEQAAADQAAADQAAADPAAVAEVVSAAGDTWDPADPAVEDAITSAARAVDAVPVLVGRGEGIGSNSWVVSGEHTETGKPMLANDPHLTLGAPGIWSQVGLHCANVSAACPFDVGGFSFAGFPGVIIGHNASLAWGITNLGADVTDFFVERVDAEGYERDGEIVPFTTRTETIKVNGGDDIEMDVRSTVHGPVISDVLEVGAVGAVPTEEDAPSGRPVAVSLGWTALTPGRTAEAVFALNLAASAQDVAAAAALFEVPSQNIIFATVDGHIGYQAPGRIPVRADVPGVVRSDGTWPRPGWDSRYDWHGYVDSAAMPAVLDPPEGFIVAANQAVAPFGAGPFLALDWDHGFRSERIRELLTAEIEAGRPLTTATMSAIQNDEHNPYAQILVPTLLEQTIPNAFDRAGQDLLVDWDYRQAADSAPAAYFAAVWAELLVLTFHDELPDAALPDGGSRWLEVVRLRLEDPTSAWWDDRTTVNVVETRDEILTRALVTARTSLTTSLGSDPEEWEWGRLHRLAPEHPVLGGDSVPGLVRSFVNPSPVDLGGGSSIVNATSWDASTGTFDVTSGASMRMVVDLADLDRSRWVVVTGVSGHPASPHYEDQLATWARGESYPWAFSREAVEEAVDDELTLVP